MHILKEILFTFSNKNSLLSSKKIERFIVFVVFIILTILYISFHLKTMDALSFIEVVGIWLSYGGVNSFLIQKDKKIESGI